MRLDGKEIATRLYTELKARVAQLQEKHITPHLVVFLVGENPASVAYVTLKQKTGEEIGAKVTILKYPTSITTQELAEKVKLLNADPFVHGILIQRPLPEQIDVDKLELLTDPQKDIDGFHPDSPYTLPLPLAVGKILEEVFCQSTEAGVAGVGTLLERLERTKRVKPSERGDSRQDPIKFNQWLQKQNIVLIGKGPTGGGPIIEYLKTLNIKPNLIDSKTKEPEQLMQQADIIISAVGREHTVKPESLKQGVALISVGINRGENKKLHGDYNEEQIKDIASFYTPTPGGVGPVNVAMLWENLITATERQTK